MTLPTTSSGWNFEWLTTWDDVWNPDFLSQWKSWMEQSSNAHVFFEPTVVRAWFETYKAVRRIEPRFLIARKGLDRLVFFPLVYDRGGWKDGWQRSLVPVGYCDFDYHDPVAVGYDGDWESFWRSFEREIRLKWMHSCDLLAIPHLRTECLPKGHQFKQTNAAPWIDLRGCTSLDDVLRMASKHLRQDVRRQISRLQNAGDLYLREFGPNDVDAAIQSLRQFLIAHRKKWPESATSPIFFELLVKYCLPCNLLSFSELRHNSKPVSWRMSFFHHERFYLYIVAYSPEAATYSPGKVHLALLLEHAISLHANALDLLCGLEPHKLKWPTTVCPLYGVEWKAGGYRAEITNLWQKKIRPRLVMAKRSLLNRFVAQRA